MSTSSPTRFRLDPWQIVEDVYHPRENRAAESVFSLANEYMGTRGLFEEGLPENSLEGCYLGGIYFREKTTFEWKRPGFPSFMNSMAHTTNWLKILVEVDGEALQMNSSTVTGYRRVLDLKTAVLTRELVFTTRKGLKTQFRWERFLSLDDRHLAIQRLAVIALNHHRPIRLAFLLDGAKGNQTEVTKTGIHSDVLFQAAQADNMVLAMKVRSTGQYYIHRMAICLDAALAEPQVNRTAREKVVEQSVEFIPETGREYRFEKRVSAWTSRDAGHPHGLIPKSRAGSQADVTKEADIRQFLIERSRAHLQAVASADYDALRAKHAAHLEALWVEVDIEIDGDVAAQQGIRYCLFQLLNTYRGGDPHLNIGAKGMTGEVYDGRAFWDTESYCIPFFIHTHPEAAKRLLEFRHGTLDAARSRARDMRYQGAIYPFTTIDGTEDCVVWDLAFSEIHINAIIPFAIHQYVRATGDRAYLYDKGAEVLVEQARFWACRTCYIPYRNGYGINRVTGPDEWHIWSNNNFYTNTMAKWTLEYAAGVVGDMMRGQTGEALDALRRKTGLKPDEPARWREVAEKMILPYEAGLGIFPQDDLFLSLDPFSREQLDPAHDIPLERHWTVEKWYKTDMVKQPDVLLALFLLRDRFTLEEKRNNYRFYEQRTAHGSSLSPCIHSILAAEIGRYEQAYAYYLWASRLDLDDLNQSVHEGLHISSMAGSWLNLVTGFGGMTVRDDGIAFNPILPGPWRSYSFRVAYRGSTIQVRVDDSHAHYRVLRGAPVAARLSGRDTVIGDEECSVPLDEAFRKRARLQAVLLDLDGAETPACILELQNSLRAAGVASAAGAPMEPAELPQAAAGLGTEPENCVLITTSPARIEAAQAVGMKTLGIGDKMTLHKADTTLASTRYLTVERLRMLF